jgi:hypothetical protein
MSTEPYFVLNRNAGDDTIHRNPREECNVDDAEGRDWVDPDTAEALLKSGDAVRCQHCYPEEQA